MMIILSSVKIIGFQSSVCGLAPLGTADLDKEAEQDSQVVMNKNE